MFMFNHNITGNRSEIKISGLIKGQNLFTSYVPVSFCKSARVGSPFIIIFFNYCLSSLEGRVLKMKFGLYLKKPKVLVNSK